jgi:hypothetical protein
MRRPGSESRGSLHQEADVFPIEKPTFPALGCHRLLYSQAGTGTPQGTRPAQCRKVSWLKASISSTAAKPSMR